jgi:predicted secreted protein
METAHCEVVVETDRTKRKRDSIVDRLMNKWHKVNDEKGLFRISPDAMSRRLVGSLISQLERQTSLQITAMRFDTEGVTVAVHGFDVTATLQKTFEFDLKHQVFLHNSGSSELSCS